LGNHLGSAALEVDESGAVISYEEYHPYGTTAYWSASSAVEVSRKRYRYTGKEKDEETGLYYHGARYYAPWLGRWTAADPLGMADGTNLCWYASGNPVIMIDPAGTVPTKPSPEEVRTLTARVNSLKGDLAAHEHTLGVISQMQRDNEKAISESKVRQEKLKGKVAAREEIVQHKFQRSNEVLAEKYAAELQHRNRVLGSLTEAEAKLDAHNEAVAEIRTGEKLQRQGMGEIEADLHRAEYFNGEKYTTEELNAALQEASKEAGHDPAGTRELWMKKIAQLEARPPGSARPAPAPATPPSAPPPPTAPVPKTGHVGTPAGPPSGPHDVDVDLNELDEVDVDLSGLEATRPAGKTRSNTGGTELGVGVAAGLGAVLNVGGYYLMYRQFQDLMHPPPRYSPHDYTQSTPLKPWEKGLPNDPI